RLSLPSQAAPACASPTLPVKDKAGRKAWYSRSRTRSEPTKRATASMTGSPAPATDVGKPSQLQKQEFRTGRYRVAAFLLPRAALSQRIVRDQKSRGPRICLLRGYKPGARHADAG